MRAGDFLAAMQRLPMADPQAVLPPAFIVLSPHPDDESLGVGGLIAAATAAGHDVRIVLVTDGSGSHPASPSYPRDRLIALRHGEARAAAVILGVPDDHLVALGLPDTAAPLAGPAFEAAVQRIVALAQAIGAGALLVSWEHDPHCDHEASAAMARAVGAALPGLDLWAYPIWGRHLDPETLIDAPPPEGVRVDVSPWLDQKHRAIAAHASQMADLIQDDPTGFRFTPATLAPFLEPIEFLIRVPR